MSQARGLGRKVAKEEEVKERKERSRSRKACPAKRAQKENVQARARVPAASEGKRVCAYAGCA